MAVEEAAEASAGSAAAASAAAAPAATGNVDGLCFLCSGGFIPPRDRYGATIDGAIREGTASAVP